MEARKQENQSLAEPPQTLTIVDEIQRLTVVVYSDGGSGRPRRLRWHSSRGLLTLTNTARLRRSGFFMVSSAIQKANLIAPTVGTVIKMYDGQLTSSSVTAFRDSLQTSKPDTDTQTQNAQPETSYIPS
jgi:hypothetical protein